MMLPQVTPDFAVIKAVIGKINGTKNEVPVPSTQLVVNESRAKGLNRDIDNLLDEEIEPPKRLAVPEDDMFLPI
jgi:hypothetical protein